MEWGYRTLVRITRYFEFLTEYNGPNERVIIERKKFYEKELALADVYYIYRGFYKRMRSYEESMTEHSVLRMGFELSNGIFVSIEKHVYSPANEVIYVDGEATTIPMIDLTNMRMYLNLKLDRIMRNLHREPSETIFTYINRRLKSAIEPIIINLEGKGEIKIKGVKSTLQKVEFHSLFLVGDKIVSRSKITYPSGEEKTQLFDFKKSAILGDGTEYMNICYISPEGNHWLYFDQHTFLEIIVKEYIYNG